MNMQRDTVRLVPATLCWSTRRRVARGRSALNTPAH
jgi:hypothetical protein